MIEVGEERVVAPRPLVALPARLAVLLSGRGSNFEALALACSRGELPGRIVVVASDRPAAAGLARAEALGLPSRLVDPKALGGRQGQEEALAELLTSFGADVVCLAGYMRLLSSAFVERFRHRIVNIHPSLLPSFPGKDAQAQAIAHGVKFSGVTVHLVDAGVDSGPILAQEPVPVLDGDDAERLSERILAVEHRLYVRALGRYLLGGWELSGRRLTFPGEAGSPPGVQPPAP